MAWHGMAWHGILLLDTYNMVTQIGTACWIRTWHAQNLTIFDTRINVFRYTLHTNALGQSNQPLTHIE
jgi:hypothetical protein